MNGQVQKGKILSDKKSWESKFIFLSVTFRFISLTSYAKRMILMNPNLEPAKRHWG